MSAMSAKNLRLLYLSHNGHARVPLLYSELSSGHFHRDPELERCVQHLNVGGEIRSEASGKHMDAIVHVCNLTEDMNLNHHG